MIQNISVGERCQECSGSSFVLDSISGDTICDTCGLCRNDVQFDSYGNAPPESNSLCLQEVNSTLSARSLRKKLDQMYHVFGINPAFEQYGYDCLAYIEQRRIQLRGIRSDHVCLAIIYQTHLHFGVFFDMVEAGKYVNALVGKIKGLADRFFAGFQQNTSLHDTTDDKKIQNYIFKASQDLEIPIKSISCNLLTALKHMPKSTKMKAAVCMYIQDVTKLKDIMHYTNIQRIPLLNAVSESCRASGEPLPNSRKEATSLVKVSGKKRKIL